MVRSAALTVGIVLMLFSGAGQAAAATADSAVDSARAYGAAYRRSNEFHVAAISRARVDGRRAYGVLHADQTYRSQDQRAGIGVFVISIEWSRWEPSQGGYSASYIDSVKAIVREYFMAGDITTASVGLQYPPLWVSSLANGELKDQHGSPASLAPNYEFSAAVQAAERAYIADVTTTLGTMISQYRLGVGEYGEMQYPDPSSDRDGTWWIGSAGGDLPSGVGGNPMPGWLPGTGTWKGGTVTVADARHWYDWYEGALDQALVVEGTAFRSAGFTGQLALLAAGQGAEPPLYQSRIDALLADPGGADPYGTMNTGTLFQNMIPFLAAHVSGPLIVDATGAGDGSGSTGKVDCRSGDAGVDTSPGSTAMAGWSTTRWTHALAAASSLGFELENQEFNSPNDTEFGLFTSCDGRYLQWLTDDSLRDGGGGHTPPDVQVGVAGQTGTYADEITRNPVG